MKGPIWVVVEHAKGEITETAKEMLQDASLLGQQLAIQVWAIIVTNEVDQERWEEQVGMYGADQLLVLHLSSLPYLTPEIYCFALDQLAQKEMPSLVLVANTSVGHEIGVRLASKWKAGFANDCVSFKLTPEGKLEAVSLTYGEQLETIRVFEKEPVVFSFRPNSAGVGPPIEGRKCKKVYEETILIDKRSLKEHVERVIPAHPKEIDITEADFIIAGGQGIGSKENFVLLERVAESLGASVACTRLADDNGWVGQERRVGLTGKTVKPQVYIAVGISGAREHIVGMDKSKNIIAINNDPRAEIFNLAHLGILGDAREVMQALLEKLANK